MARVLVTRRLPDGGTDPLVDAGHEIVARDRRHALLARTSSARLPRDVDAIVCLLTDRIDADVSQPVRRASVWSPTSPSASTTSTSRRRATAGCRGVQHARRARRDHGRPRLLPPPRCRAAHVDGRGRPAERARGTAGASTSTSGYDVHGSTLGLVGNGRIGRAVGRRAAGFGMTVRHHTRHDTGMPGWTGDLDAMLAESDMVSLHVPLTDETRHLIDERRLALMRPSAVLVNTSRGPVVDEEALAAALERGAIFAAGPRRVRARARGAPPSAGRAAHGAPASRRAARRSRPAPAWHASRAMEQWQCSPGSARRTSFPARASGQAPTRSSTDRVTSVSVVIGASSSAPGTHSATTTVCSPSSTTIVRPQVLVLENVA